jgi:hypothetical protein
LTPDRPADLRDGRKDRAFPRRIAEGMSAAERVDFARALIAALGGTWHGSYGSAKCPAHDDGQPSLSVRDGETAPLLTCHAGCERSAIVDALTRHNECTAGSPIVRRALNKSGSMAPKFFCLTDDDGESRSAGIRLEYGDGGIGHPFGEAVDRQFGTISRVSATANFKVPQVAVGQ